MSAGLYLCVHNYSDAAVDVNIQFTGMETSADNPVPPLNATLGPGASTPGNPALYVQSDDIETSYFGVTITGVPNAPGGTVKIHITEGVGLYQIASITPPGFAAVDLTNAGNGLDQAWLSIAVQPFGPLYSGWMTNWPQLAQLPLNQIRLPGAHDAGTWVVQPPFDTVESSIIITQDLPIGAQLANGARYFDVRPGAVELNMANTNASVLYHVHCPDSTLTIECAPYTEMLQQCQVFNGAFRNEVLMIMLSHFQTNTVTTSGPSAQLLLKTAACQQIYNALGNSMVVSTFDYTQTLATLWSTSPGKSVFVFVDCSDGIGFGTDPATSIVITDPVTGANVNDLFWPSDSNTAPINAWGNYANTSELGTLLQWVQSNLPAPGCPNFDLLQCQNSPQPWDAATSYNNLTAAALSNPMMQQLLGVHLTPQSATAQHFAQAANCFLVDAIGTFATDLAMASNVRKLANLSATKTKT